MRDIGSVIDTPWEIPRRTGVNFTRASGTSCGTLCSDFLADIAEVGDSDFEKEQQALDSKENFPGKKQNALWRSTGKGLVKQLGCTFCLPG